MLKMSTKKKFREDSLEAGKFSLILLRKSYCLLSLVSGGFYLSLLSLSSTVSDQLVNTIATFFQNSLLKLVSKYPNKVLNFSSMYREFTLLITIAKISTSPI